MDFDINDWHVYDLANHTSTLKNYTVKVPVEGKEGEFKDENASNTTHLIRVKLTKEEEGKNIT